MSLDDFQHFHEELRAAVLARVPISLDNRRFASKANLATLKRLHTQVNPGAMTSAREFTAPVDAHLHHLPSRYRAAFAVFSKTSSMKPVLDGLSVDRLAGKQLSRMAGSPYAYLVLMIFIASAGLAFYALLINPSFENFRADLKLPLRIDVPDRAFPVGLFVTLSQVLAVVSQIGFVGLFLGGPGFIAHWFGGKHFKRCRVQSSIIRTTQSLLHQGVEVVEAVGLACDLAGTDATTREKMSQAIQARAPDGQADRLSSLLAHFELSARKRLAALRVWFPVSIVALIGGLLVVGYCVALFMPLIHLIRDLSVAGTF